MVVEAYSLLLTALLLLGGSMGDRYRRPRIFAARVPAFGLASVLCGLIGSSARGWRDPAVLAAIALPPQLPAARRKAIEDAAAAAFVGGCRAVMAVSALPAACSALDAWWLVKPPARDS